MLQSLPYLAAPKHGSHQGSRPLIVELKVENPNFDIQVWTTKKLSKTSYMKNDPYYVKRILNPTILDVFLESQIPKFPKSHLGFSTENGSIQFELPIRHHWDQFRTILDRFRTEFDVFLIFANVKKTFLRKLKIKILIFGFGQKKKCQKLPI